MERYFLSQANPQTLSIRYFHIFLQDLSEEMKGSHLILRNYSNPFVTLDLDHAHTLWLL